MMQPHQGATGLMRRSSITSLYAILNLDTNRHPLPFAEDLLAFGVRTIQVRAKSVTPEEVKETAGAVVNLARQLEAGRGERAIVIINDDPELCREVGADGVHLGQEDRAPAEARALLPPHAVIGLSTHTSAQAMAAQTVGVDYIGFGPVFASSTKSGHADVTGVEGLSRAVEISRIPVVAIGGITAENASLAFAAGAASVAVIAELERAKDLASVIARIEDASRRSSRSTSSRS